MYVSWRMIRLALMFSKIFFQRYFQIHIEYFMTHFSEFLFYLVLLFIYLLSLSKKMEIHRLSIQVSIFTDLFHKAFLFLYFKSFIKGIYKILTCEVKI